jgi:hypothetical protein
MDQRDRELLDKQLRQLQPEPRQISTTIAVMAGVFLVGVTFGGLVFSSREPVRVASSDVVPSGMPLSAMPPISR